MVQVERMQESSAPEVFEGRVGLYHAGWSKGDMAPDVAAQGDLHRPDPTSVPLGHRKVHSTHLCR